jgi:endonuclease G, mitochondrial
VSDLLERLAAKNAEIEQDDDDLREELAAKRELSVSPEARALESPGGADPSRARDLGIGIDELPTFDVETIVNVTGRPVLAVLRDEAQLTFTDPESEVWRNRLTGAKPRLVAGARAVGRIEVEGHDMDWLGTGWLVAPDVIVTNRHVASEFGRPDGAQFIFKQSVFGPRMTASIDFLEEFGRPDELTFRLVKILHIEGPAGPDLAFLRVEQLAGPDRPSPIGLSEDAGDTEFVAVIGYPARDSRIPDQAVMERIFGDVYDKKRLAPGKLTGQASNVVRHDCSTLGGNSGSVVLSLDTGEAVGLHFAGRFLEANFAVPSKVVQQRLESVLSGRRPVPASDSLTIDRPQPDEQRPVATTLPQGAAELTAVVPLRLTVTVGTPYTERDPGRSATAQVSSVAVPSGDEDVFVEARPEDYADREGYVSTFLGDDFDVPLPTVKTGKNDVLTFTVNGDREQVLRYEHFSVLMSKRRRMCRFSAVNIDGTERIRMARPGWRFDPRIPTEAQIKDECYGNAPKFARGHMTRREDPIWGSPEEASRGNSDSMHVTNVVPQMQTFNGGVWLDLEDYALFNARQDDMRISVITGPFLLPSDPIKFGVKVPVEFWKVIVFIHDQTGELSATGYTMSQDTFLTEDEFVFGRFKTSQQSISAIEQKAGLSFGQLADLDPFTPLEGVETELTSVRQIQFR